MNPGALFRFFNGQHGRAFRRMLPIVAIVAVAATVFAFQQAALPMASAQTPAPDATSTPETPAVISGHVVNGTANGVVPDDLQVILLVVNETQQAIIARDQAVVGPNGEFSFTGYQTGPDITYRVVANDGDYTPSEDLQAGQDAFDNVQLTIYDTTTSLENIHFSNYSMLVPSIDRANRQLGILTVIQLVNSGDTVWIPDLSKPNVTGFDLLRFNLPEGYTDLSIETTLPPTSNNANQLLDIGTGFALLNPVPPGENQVLITYVVGYAGSALDFPLRLAYGADLVRILTPDGQGSVTGLGLGEPQPIAIEEDNYTLVEGNNYPADSQLDVRIENLPTPNLVESLQNFFEGRTYILVIGWVVVVAMIALLVYAFFFTRKRAAAAAGGGGAAEYPEYRGLERAQIVETIAELDGKHAAGQIEDGDYEARRDALKKAALAAPKTETQPT